MSERAGKVRYFEVVHEAVECLRKKRETTRKFRFW